MKTLQQQGQAGKAKMEPEPRKKAAAPEAFTARELDAAEQLIHLSESSTSSGTRGKPRRAPSAASGSSSPRSVNAPPAPGTTARALPRADEEEEENDQEVPGAQRRTKRYRSIAEIYLETERI